MKCLNFKQFTQKTATIVTTLKFLYLGLSLLGIPTAQSQENTSKNVKSRINGLYSGAAIDSSDFITGFGSSLTSLRGSSILLASTNFHIGMNGKEWSRVSGELGLDVSFGHVFKKDNGNCQLFLALKSKGKQKTVINGYSNQKNTNKTYIQPGTSGGFICNIDMVSIIGSMDIVANFDQLSEYQLEIGQISLNTSGNLTLDINNRFNMKVGLEKTVLSTEYNVTKNFAELRYVPINKLFFYAATENTYYSEIQKTSDPKNSRKNQIATEKNGNFKTQTSTIGIGFAF